MHLTSLSGPSVTRCSRAAGKTPVRACTPRSRTSRRLPFPQIRHCFTALYTGPPFGKPVFTWSRSGRKRLVIGVNHHVYQLLETDLRPPPQSQAGLSRVTAQFDRIRVALLLRIDHDVFSVVESESVERKLAQLSHGMSLA